MNSPRGTIVCGPSYPYDSNQRTCFTDDRAKIFAWPSRGGIVVLDEAEAIDYEFLGLDPLDPPMKRLTDDSEEDAFCQRLLLLGAKWWDSEARYSIVLEIEIGAQEGCRVDSAFVLSKQPPPTMREKRLIKAGWPSTGGVWISEFDTTWAGVDEEENLIDWDENLGRLRMTRTMDERCTMLRHRFRGTFYPDLKTYRGYGFFNAWEEKELGEVGPLLHPDETRDIWHKAYTSHP
ncbi:MAG: hypothetical protein LQ352_006204 [Teloschistes flavicans]|nr:MAG: hypothetical protein LQ352_006204 [Teloschistes flavicans]